jgi:hypothetical protein
MKTMKEIGKGFNGIADALVLIFVVLKLTNLIDWSWWWVFSPWIIMMILVSVILSIAIGIGIMLIINKK